MKKLTMWSISLVILLGLMGLGLADKHYNHDKHHYHNYLTHINPHFMITPHEAYAWHLFKDAGRPDYSGSPNWRRYIEFVEAKLREAGLVDIIRHTWTYNRYYVNDFPVHEGPLDLISDGTRVPVATFGMTSGSTPIGGTTAQMVFYDPASPPASIEGKIVVFKTAPNPPTPPPYSLSYRLAYTFTDYEYCSDVETFPPIFEYVPPSENNSFNTRYVFAQLNGFATKAINGKAAGMVVVYDLPWGTAKGLYQRTVYSQDGTVNTPYVNCPTLCLDRVSGAKVVQDAKNGKIATLKLLAEWIPSDVYRFIGFLPGKNYGTEKDEQIGIESHTGGMSLTQENGALGVLGVVHYFSQIPQSERPKTLLVYINCTHFMPGGDGGWEKHDLLEIYPELLKPVVAVVGMEHMGELEGIEIGNNFMLSGKAEYSYLGVDNNDFLIDIAIKAIKDNNWPRCQLTCDFRPGIHGLPQLDAGTVKLRRLATPIPGFGLAGNWPGAHTQTFAGIERFDKHLFVTQVAGMSQIVGNLMLVDPVVIDYVWGELNLLITNLPDGAFNDPTKASKLRDVLLDKDEAIFNEVRSGEYKGAIHKLKNLKKKIIDWIVVANQAALITKIDKAIAKCSQAD